MNLARITMPKFFSWLKPCTVETPMIPTIKETSNGYALFDRAGELVGTYSRARDAKRGAARRGLTL